MSNPLVECIPNFSEARNTTVIDEIVQSIKAIDGVKILDRHSDMDHNRTVITLIGPPKNIEEAAFQFILTASRLIDLNHHIGAHPRIGATDVVPFIPIQNISMHECVEIARRLGSRVANTLSIPVYLYEEAAIRPDRKNLEDIRRGEYEQLKHEIRTNPDRKPDFGPDQIGPAGATVIGARNPLIAFNMYLTTGDVKIAQAIARAVRYSSGGFRNVKALGLFVDGHAQVSMNLTNFRQTPLPRVAEFVRREAEHYGVNIKKSELVGLIPLEALADSASWYLNIDNFHPNQVLEYHLQMEKLTSDKSTTFQTTDFLDNLASGTPTPGGGAAAAVTAAQAAALISMVTRLSLDRVRLITFFPEFENILTQSEQTRSRLLELISEDSRAINRLLEVQKNLQKTQLEDINTTYTELDNVAQKSCEIPYEVIQLAKTIIDLAMRVSQICLASATPDAFAAIYLAIAAIRISEMNIRTNAILVSNNQVVLTILNNLSKFEEHVILAERQLAIFQNSRLK